MTLKARRTLVLTFAALSLVAPATAQNRGVSPSYDDPPAVSLRPFFLASGQNFTANETFKAVFGRTVEPFWGGGAQVTFRSGLFVDVTVSRFQSVRRARVQVRRPEFRVGHPADSHRDASGGQRRISLPRVAPARSLCRRRNRLVLYEETSDFSNEDENVKTRHTGYLVNGGAEFRLSRWLGLTADVQYTRVPGILGDGGISKEADEHDLGGVAARFRVIVGR